MDVPKGLLVTTNALRSVSNYVIMRHVRYGWKIGHEFLGHICNMGLGIVHHTFKTINLPNNIPGPV